jgi:hypothetical protein
MHFDAGLRSRTELNVRGDLEDLLGVRLVFKRDLEPGGASYEYTPYPVPEYGLTDISVRLNEDWVSDGSGPAGLFCLVSTGWRGDNLLDLGRLHRLMQSRFGDRHQAVGYVLIVSPEAAVPLLDRVQRFEFDWDRESQQATAPCLQTVLEFGLPEQDVAAVHSELDSAVVDPVIRLRALQLTLAPSRSGPMRTENDAFARFRLAFETPSLLDLGCLVEALEARWAEALTIVTYRVHGSLIQGGPEFCFERWFKSAQDLVPAWRHVSSENRGHS